MFDAWRELHRTEVRNEATAVVTTIRAMGFPGRIASPRDRWHSDDDVPSGDVSGPFVVFVHEDHRVDLADVLTDIIEEQAAFDHSIARRDARQGRVQRGAILIAAFAIGAMALMGWIDL